MAQFQAPGSGQNFENVHKLVEQIIRGFGVDPQQCRDKKEGQWTLVRGSATIYVDVYDVKGAGYICVSSPIMKVTTNQKEQLFEKLLRLNHQMYAAAFSINTGQDGVTWVWLRIVRETEGLDLKEAQAMFNRVGYYADQHDDDLKAGFGG